MSSPQRQMIAPGTVWWNAEHGRYMVWNGQAWEWTMQPMQQQGPTMSVHYEKRQTSMLFHLVMTVLTGGLWLFVWLFAALRNDVSRGRKVTTKYR